MPDITQNGLLIKRGNLREKDDDMGKKMYKSREPTMGATENNTVDYAVAPIIPTLCICFNSKTLDDTDVRQSGNRGDPHR